MLSTALHHLIISSIAFILPKPEGKGCLEFSLSSAYGVDLNVQIGQLWPLLWEVEVVRNQNQKLLKMEKKEITKDANIVSYTNILSSLN